MLCLVILGAGLALLSSGCAGGKYFLDVFPEMHYQPSFRAQEPPMRGVPSGAVPVTGAGQAEVTAERSAEIPNPLTMRPKPVGDTARLYQTNCLPCHGASGKGDGPLAVYYQTAGARPPADLTSDPIQSRMDAELFNAITHGLRDPETLVGMPAFVNVLRPDERHALVSYIRSLAGR